MKRALTALPLLALAIGLAVFLLRRAPSTEAPPKAPAAGPVTTPPAPSDAPKPPPVTHGVAAKDAAPGDIRFALTFRGLPAGVVDVVLQRVGIDNHAKFKTEADGTQWIRDLPPGEYTYSFKREGAVFFSGDVQVGPGQTATVAVELKPGGRIHGTVTDRAGQPVPETRVFLFEAEKNVPHLQSSVFTDKDGKYAMTFVPPGTFGVRFRNIRYKPLDRLGLLFRNGGDEYRIDVVLEDGATISGRVIDEQNAPIEGADLLGAAGDSVGQAKSAADGSFQVTGLTDEPASISAAKPGYGKLILRNLTGNPTGVILRLQKAGTILGRLKIDQVPRQTQVTLSTYDKASGQVVPVESRFFALPSTATFSFEDVPAGTYWVDVLVSGYEAVDRPEITVASGQITRPVVISMQKKN